MNFAQEQKTGSRLTGFGVVVLIHVLLVWGLAAGLHKKVVDAVKGPIDVKVVEEEVKPPPPPEKVEPPPPDIKAPPPPYVPPPEVVVTAPPPPMAVQAPVSTTPPPSNNIAPTPAPAPPAPVAAPKPATKNAAGACTKMGKPETPAVNWSGSAEYKANISVKAGRVADVEFVPVRRITDRKAERAVLANLKSTLMDTYECPGDHPLLIQEFVINIE
ncbi:ABC transporter substrate-binding protein [Roseateles sp. BYS180W]|uniref:ABC transporter substrate-binding protein n=1 Tax=Roseateles rivi TaxID=3299028 RepID=A0ABW7FYS0_9BURK